MDALRADRQWEIVGPHVCRGELSERGLERDGVRSEMQVNDCGLILLRRVPCRVRRDGLPAHSGHCLCHWDVGGVSPADSRSFLAG